MQVAERNRLIKQVLKKAFNTKVTVRGSKGSAYGWVSVHIDYSPKDRTQRRELEKQIWLLFAANKIEIDTYGYDDPGSDYGYGRKIHLGFNELVYNGPYETDPARN